jgi:HAD superfamily hydrolase (TIGR01509 family)
VLLDFGGTLAHVNEEGNQVYKKQLLSVVREFGFEEGLSDFTSVFDDALRLSHEGAFKTLEEFWSLVVERLGIYGETEDLSRELEERRIHHSPSAYKIFEGAIATLGHLQKRYSLALVSNCAIGTADAIRELGLSDFFECISLSYEVGVRKPGKPMYVETLKCLRLEPHECVFVADEISDLEGARDVGIKTMLVRQSPDTISDSRDPNFRPDFECNRISEISRFL